MGRDDAELTDETLRREIEDLADLMAVAGGACEHLTPEQVDSVLGVSHVDGGQRLPA